MEILDLYIQNWGTVFFSDKLTLPRSSKKNPDIRPSLGGATLVILVCFIEELSHIILQVK